MAYVDYEDPAILPVRSNDPPAILLGCTYTEVITIGVASLLFWLLIGVPLALLLGFAMYVLSGIVLLTGGTAVFLLGALAQFKEGKPTGYYQHKALLFLERFSLGMSHIYQEDGQLSLGRSEQYLRRNINVDVGDDEVDARTGRPRDVRHADQPEG